MTLLARLHSALYGQGRLLSRLRRHWHWTEPENERPRWHYYLHGGLGVAFYAMSIVAAVTKHPAATWFFWLGAFLALDKLREWSIKGWHELFWLQDAEVCRARRLNLKLLDERLEPMWFHICVVTNLLEAAEKQARKEDPREPN